MARSPSTRLSAPLITCNSVRSVSSTQGKHRRGTLAADPILRHAAILEYPPLIGNVEIASAVLAALSEASSSALCSSAPDSCRVTTALHGRPCLGVSYLCRDLPSRSRGHHRDRCGLRRLRCCPLAVGRAEGAAVVQDRVTSRLHDPAFRNLRGPSVYTTAGAGMVSGAG